MQDNYLWCPNLSEDYLLHLAFFLRLLPSFRTTKLKLRKKSGGPRSTDDFYRLICSLVRAINRTHIWRSLCSAFLAVQNVTLEDLISWTKAHEEGVIVGFSPENLRTVCYFLDEFAEGSNAPSDKIDAIRLGEFLVVGKKWFLQDVRKGLGLVE